MSLLDEVIVSLVDNVVANFSTHVPQIFLPCTMHKTNMKQRLRALQLPFVLQDKIIFSYGITANFREAFVRNHWNNAIGWKKRILF